MLHARKDYNERVQDSKNIIPKDEPVFLLRGQDIFAPMLLELYANMVASIDAVADSSIVKNTRKHAEAMRKWQKEVREKYPDMDETDSVY